MIFAKKTDETLYLTGSGVIDSNKKPSIRKAFAVSPQAARILRIIWGFLLLAQLADIAAALALNMVTLGDIDRQVKIFAVLGGGAMISYFISIPGLIPIGRKVAGVTAATTVQKRDSFLYHGLVALCFFAISANGLGMISLFPGSVPVLYVAVLTCLMFAGYQLFIIYSIFAAKHV